MSKEHGHFRQPPPLANAGRLDELEKLVDRALEMLGETEKVPDGSRPE